MLPALAPLHASGYAVLMLDARCHGRSDDARFTSLPRFAEDIEAGLNWLRTAASVDPGRLAIMGHSVGAGAALLCATRRTDVRAVISLSAFAHPREIMHTYLAQAHIPYPVLGWYVIRHVQAVIGAGFDAIAPLTSIARLGCPVLLVHGSDDELVPFTDAQRLLAAGPKGLVQCLRVAGGHDPSAALQAHVPALVDFLNQALSVASPEPNPTPSHFKEKYGFCYRAGTILAPAGPGPVVWL
jgi:pimeloyl-ACP methyl ester carboxylesterase